MSRLATSVAGAVLGVAASFIPGVNVAFWTAAAIGWGVGTAVGSYLFAPKPAGPENQYQEGPRLNELVMRGGSYGSSIPEVWGRARLGGLVIWKQPLEEEKNTESTIIEGGGGGKGGKGGGGSSAVSTTVSYEYYATFAVAICEGPVNVGRIWLNSKLAHGGTQDSLINPYITIYLGDDTQEPDPTMEAFEGVGNVPANRGTCYIVFDRLPLKDFGYSIPNVEVEVTRSPISYCLMSGLTERLNFNPPDTHKYWAWQQTSDEPETGRIIYSGGRRTDLSGSNYKYQAGRLVYDAYTGTELSHQVSADYYVGGWGSPFPSYQFEGGQYSVWSSNHFYDANYNKLTLNFKDNPIIVPPSWWPNQTERIYYQGRIPGLIVEDLFLYTNQDMTKVIAVKLVREDPEDPTSVAIGYSMVKEFDIPIQVEAFGLVQRDTIDRWWLVWAESTVTNNCTIQRIGFDLENDQIVVYNTFTLYSDGVFDDYIRWAAILIAADCVIHTKSKWTLKTSHLDFDTDTVSGVDNLGGDTGTARQINENYILGTKAPGDLIGVYSGTYASDNSTVRVGEIVQDLCERSGLTAPEIDTSLLTDEIVGYTRTQTMAIRSAIAPLQNISMFDAVESDGVLKFIPIRDASGATGLTLTDEDLGAHPYGASEPQLLEVNRVSMLDTPREYRVVFSDPNRDYDTSTQRAINPAGASEHRMELQLPMVLTASQGKSIAYRYLTATLQDKISMRFSLMPNNLALEPSDIITLSTSDRGTYEVRLIRVEVSPSGVLSCEAAVYSQSSYDYDQIAEENGGPAELPRLVASIVMLLDIPILRTIDSGSTGIYAVGSPRDTWENPWPGAELYYQSGAGWALSTYWSEGASSTYGVLNATLPAAPQPWAWDDTNEVLVQLNSAWQSNPLVSSTDEEVMAGANQAAIGTHGRWEIIGYVNAEDLGFGQYRLTRLLRARRGTEHVMGASAVGDSFVLLDTVGTRRAAHTPDLIDVEANWRIVPEASRVGLEPSIPFISAGVGSTPFAPVNIQGVRDASGDLTVGWTRRSRCAIEQEMGETYDVCETIEQYHVEFRVAGGSALLRTVVVDSITETMYSLAAYGADIGDQSTTAIPTLDVTVYQISTVVGRGYSGTGTV